MNISLRNKAYLVIEYAIQKYKSERKKKWLGLSMMNNRVGCLCLLQESKVIHMTDQRNNPMRLQSHLAIVLVS